MSITCPICNGSGTIYYVDNPLFEISDMTECYPKDVEGSTDKKKNLPLHGNICYRCCGIGFIDSIEDIAD